ncbi:hypothetical protein [Actinokineospora sp.]|uniref:hypothetical protein n=1 Tax=Actinokineospora sp. TaxID=1872133 RepID=UPI004037AC26
MAERFTDEEFAFLRFVRFGELPPRVLPADLVELKETDPAPDYPNLAFDATEWGGGGYG